MPLYTFKCPECKDVQEHVLPMDHNSPVCSHCNCIKSQIITRAPNVKFVGAGFYSNDYKEKNYDHMTNLQRDDHDKRQADKLDDRYEKEEKAFREKVRDDLR